MKREYLLIFLASIVIHSHFISAQQLPDSVLLNIGKPIELESEILDQNRKLYVHLPLYYDTSQYYPMIVLLDGEITFKAFAGVTELMGFQNLIPHCIVVGLVNVDREKDHAPKMMGNPESGRADLMIRFYEQELLPFLDKNYNINVKFLWGHSFLGMFTTYVMMTKPELFDVYIATSPAYYYMYNIIEKFDFSNFLPDERKYFYYSYGSLEDRTMADGRFQQKLELNTDDNLVIIRKIHKDKKTVSNALHSYMDALQLLFNPQDM